VAHWIIIIIFMHLIVVTLHSHSRVRKFYIHILVLASDGPVEQKLIVSESVCAL